MVVDELHGLGERREVLQLEIRVALDAVGRAHGGEELGLLDGVDAEVGLEVEVHGEHLARITGLLGDQREHAVAHLVAPCRGRRGGGRRGRTGGRRGRLGGGEVVSGLVGQGAHPIDHAQGALDRLELGRRIPAGAGEPGAPGRGFLDAMGEAEICRSAALAVGRRRPAEQGHADLGAEAGAQAERVAHGVRPTAGQVELP